MLQDVPASKLSPKAIAELREIVREEYEEDFSDREIEDMGTRLLKLFAILLARPTSQTSEPNLTLQERTALEFLKAEIGRGRSPSVREIASAVSLRSSRSGARVLRSLIAKGILSRDSSGKLGFIS